MRTTAERRGQPDRSRAGNFRSEGHPDQSRRSSNPRRGYPDRSNTGTARQLDRRRETRNRLRDQHGYDFVRIQMPHGDTAGRPATPGAGDARLNTSFSSIDSLEWYDETNDRWVNLRSTAEHNGAVNIGCRDVADNFADDNVEDVLAAIATALIARPVSTDVMLLDGSQEMTGDQGGGNQDYYNIKTIAVGVSSATTVALVEIRANPAATPDDAKSLALVNPTSATSGNQKITPMLRMEGQGFSSDLGGATIVCEYRQYGIPVQGTAAPTVDWVLESAINGSWTNQLRFTQAKRILVVGAGATTVEVGVDAGIAFIGNWKASTGFAVFAHTSVKDDTGSYGFLHQSNGTSYINTASGTTGHLREANVDIGTWTSNGVFLSRRARTVTANTSITIAADSTVLVDASGGARTITLPAVATSNGRDFTIKKIDSSGNAVTIDGNSAETIDGATTAVINAQYESVTVHCDGTEWWIL